MGRFAVLFLLFSLLSSLPFQIKTKTWDRRGRGVEDFFFCEGEEEEQEEEEEKSFFARFEGGR